MSKWISFTFLALHAFHELQLVFNECKLNLSRRIIQLSVVWFLTLKLFFLARSIEFKHFDSFALFHHLLCLIKNRWQVKIGWIWNSSNLIFDWNGLLNNYPLSFNIFIFIRLFISFNRWPRMDEKTKSCDSKNYF